MDCTNKVLKVPSDDVFEDAAFVMGVAGTGLGGDGCRRGRYGACGGHQGPRSMDGSCVVTTAAGKCARRLSAAGS